MSLLQQMRMNRNSKAQNYYNSLVARENASGTLPPEEKAFDPTRISRSHNIKVITDNKRKLTDRVIKTRAEVKRKMELPKASEVEKNEREVQNSDLTSLISGFLDSENKKKYIKVNNKSFKGLPSVEQRTLFSLYLKYL